MNAENIKKITEDIVSQLGFYLVGFNFRGHGKNQVVEVFIDGKNYINADDCAIVSRHLNEKYRAMFSPDDSYRLDVSSPGIDRPLKFIEQFPKHLNKKFEISYSYNNEIRKTNAELINVNNDELSFLTRDGKELIIKFKDIIKAKVLISFS